MVQSKQSVGASLTTSNLRQKTRFSHWVRVAISFLSFGFVFPHALTEDEHRDIAKYDIPEENAGKKE